MTWRNLRGEIGEIFTEYSRGEYLSEAAQGFEAKRRAQAIEYQALYRHRIRSNPLLLARKQALWRLYWEDHKAQINERRKRNYQPLPADQAERKRIREQQRYKANREKRKAQSRAWYYAAGKARRRGQQ